MTEVKERPILFSGPMVRAILGGRKTQTRRVISPQPKESWMLHQNKNTDWSQYYKVNRWGKSEKYLWISHPTENKEIACPYGAPGDRLWVRETWATQFNERFHDEHGLPAPDYLVDSNSHEPVVVYAADGGFPMLINGEFMAEHSHVAWKPSIHMRRKASRISLEIKSVRVERLKSVSGFDARAEGYPEETPDHRLMHDGGGKACRRWFRGEWDMLNAKRGYSWESNPWVWVIEFRKL